MDFNKYLNRKRSIIGVTALLSLHDKEHLFSGFEYYFMQNRGKIISNSTVNDENQRMNDIMNGKYQWDHPQST